MSDSPERLKTFSPRESWEAIELYWWLMEQQVLSEPASLQPQTMYGIMLSARCLQIPIPDRWLDYNIKKETLQ